MFALNIWQQQPISEIIHIQHSLSTWERAANRQNPPYQLDLIGFFY